MRSLFSHQCIIIFVIPSSTCSLFSSDISEIHTLTIICNRDIRYFLWNLSNHFQNFMPGCLDIALLQVKCQNRRIFSDVIYLFTEIGVVLSNRVSQVVSTK